MHKFDLENFVAKWFGSFQDHFCQFNAAILLLSWIFGSHNEKIAQRRINTCFTLNCLVSNRVNITIAVKAEKSHCNRICAYSRYVLSRIQVLCNLYNFYLENFVAKEFGSFRDHFCQFNAIVFLCTICTNLIPKILLPKGSDPSAIFSVSLPRFFDFVQLAQFQARNFVRIFPGK